MMLKLQQNDVEVTTYDVAITTYDYIIQYRNYKMLCRNFEIIFYVMTFKLLLIYMNISILDLTLEKVMARFLQAK